MRRVRGWTWLSGVALLVAALAMGSAAAAPDPEEVGVWTAPFEEGGAATPRCVTGADGRIDCKPTAVSASVLPDGRVLYLNGLESTENIRYSVGPELSPESRNSTSRVLDLHTSTPAWTTPTPNDGGASNPNIRPGSDGTDDPLGMFNAPGRPGDGLTGSFWGMIGGPAHNPTSPPDDIQTNDGDMFCTDVVQLADGRILIAGGTDWYNEPAVMDRDSGAPADVGFIELEGLRNARIFNPVDGTYSQVGHMKYGRWYPSLVTLADGRVVAFSGVTKLIKNMQGSQVRRTETFDPSTGEWTENYTGPSSENSLPLYPRLHLMPNGKILYAGLGQTWGPAGDAVDELLWGFQQFFDPATGTWEMLGPSRLGTRGGAAQIMMRMEPPYDEATLLTFGGTLGPSPSTYLALPISELVTVRSDGTVVNESTGDLNKARWFPSSVGLPDGTVLALSGGTADEVIFPGTERPVRMAELYDPATGTWRELSAGARDRTYHNSAVLLPDARVLVGGHSPGPWYDTHHDFGFGFANRDKDSSFEVFSPPYLFRGERPAITGVRRGIAWGSSFAINTPDATDIEQVVLSRLPSPQHVTDSDARTLSLSFTPGAGSVTAVAPPTGTIAPPGFYYLFILRSTDQGPVPSVARIVQIGETNNLTPTAPIYASANPAPPSGTATELEDSSYINKPPPLPFGMVAVGFIVAGAGLPARTRRRGQPDETA